MSGMFAVSKPPMISTDGLRSSQASVIGKKRVPGGEPAEDEVGAQHAGISLSGLGTRPGW